MLKLHHSHFSFSIFQPEEGRMENYYTNRILPVSRIRRYIWIALMYLKGIWMRIVAHRE